MARDPQLLYSQRRNPDSVARAWHMTNLHSTCARPVSPNVHPASMDATRTQGSGQQSVSIRSCNIFQIQRGSYAGHEAYTGAHMLSAY